MRLTQVNTGITGLIARRSRTDLVRAGIRSLVIPAFLAVQPAIVTRPCGSPGYLMIRMRHVRDQTSRVHVLGADNKVLLKIWLRVGKKVG